MSTSFGSLFVPVVDGDNCPQCTWQLFIDATSAIHATSNGTVDFNASGSELTISGRGGAARRFVQPKRGPFTGITEFVRMTGKPVTPGASHPAKITSAMEGAVLVHTVEVV